MEKSTTNLIRHNPIKGVDRVKLTTLIFFSNFYTLLYRIDKLYIGGNYNGNYYYHIGIFVRT